jgi:uncharacterized Rmd1/YagE family protein
MASTESTPLIPKPSLQSHSNTPSKPQRTVTFNPTVQSSSSTAVAGPRNPPASAQLGQPVLTTLNNKIRRRHSQGAAGAFVPALPVQKIGPQRTTKTAQKLKILPDPEHGDDGPDEESGRDVYAQFTRIKDPTARRDAARLGKEDRKRLPRVTAYCTAGSYRMEELMRYLKGKARLRGAVPKLFDECIYTPYHYGTRDTNSEHQQRKPGSSSEGSTTPQRRFSDSAVEVESHNEQRREEMIDMHTSGGDVSLDIGDGPLLVPNHAMPAEEDIYTSSMPDTLDFDTEVHTPELFLFSYGTLVIWGMTLQQELRFLKEMAKFEVEKLDKDDVQTEDFNFYYTREYQARIYNDFISLRDKKNYMTKLAISHALAQSVKVSFANIELLLSLSWRELMRKRHPSTKTSSTAQSKPRKKSRPRSPRREK